MLLLLRLNQPTVVTGSAELTISVGFEARSVVTTTPVGPAWIGVEVDTVNDGVQTSVGGSQIGAVLAEDPFGTVTPGEITSIQHQGSAQLTIRAGFTDDGRVQPILTVPKQAQTGKAQMAVAISGAAAPVEMRFAFEAGGETTRTGEVVEHPQQLGIEFRLPPASQTIVAIPPLPDWNYLRTHNHTEALGDAEFFDPAAPTSGGDSAIKSWASLPADFTWDDVPDELTWDDADALWAS